MDLNQSDNWLKNWVIKAIGFKFLKPFADITDVQKRIFKKLIKI